MPKILLNTFEEQRERLTTLNDLGIILPLWVSVFSFFLVLILNTKLLSGFNFRLGNNIDYIETSSKVSTPDSLVWFSVSLDKDKIKIVSKNSEVFFLNTSNPNDVQFKNFLNFLKEKKIAFVENVGLSNNKDLLPLRAIIALDQSLTFQAIRPIFLALSKAGINEYAFETKSLQKVK